MNPVVVVTPESLTFMVNSIVENLLDKRFEVKAKKYLKIDFHAIVQDQFFTIQLTKCSSNDSNLKFLLTNALRPLLREKKLKNQTVVGIIEEKTLTNIQVQKVVCTRNTSISLINEPDLDLNQGMKDFYIIKRYVSFKILFQVDLAQFDLFSSLMLCYIMQFEDIHQNVKFSFRKDYKHIYRNQTSMDDIILSCMLMSSYCASIYKRSEDEDFKNELENSFKFKKSSDLEKMVGSLLLAKANNNFNSI